MRRAPSTSPSPRFWLSCARSAASFAAKGPVTSTWRSGVAVSNSQTGITGFGGFIAPLDITHNVNNGDIYVTEHDTDTGGQHIYRLRPNP